MAPKRNRSHDNEPGQRRQRPRPTPQASSSGNASSAQSTSQRAQPPPVAPLQVQANEQWHNIHLIGHDGHAQHCRNGSCPRCLNFRTIQSRAREYGCILVRPGEEQAVSYIDNDDNDPDQPTYREDNESFEMICQLEEDKQRMQKEIEELKGHERENVKLKEDLETAKKSRKELATLKGQLTVSKKKEENSAAVREALQLLRAQNEELTVQLRTQEGKAAAAHEVVYLIKGTFVTLEQANLAFQHLCKIVFPDFRSLKICDDSASDADPMYVRPDVGGDALRWKSNDGEWRVAVHERQCGVGYLWVEKRAIMGQVELDELLAEKKAVKRKAKKASKRAARRAEALGSDETQATDQGNEADAGSQKEFSDIEEEGFEADGSAAAVADQDAPHLNAPQAVMAASFSIDAAKHEEEDDSAGAMQFIPHLGSIPHAESEAMWARSDGSNFAPGSAQRDESPEFLYEVTKRESTPEQTAHHPSTSSGRLHQDASGNAARPCDISFHAHQSVYDLPQWAATGEASVHRPPMQVKRELSSTPMPVRMKTESESLSAARRFVH